MVSDIGPEWIYGVAAVYISNYLDVARAHRNEVSRATGYYG